MDDIGTGRIAGKRLKGFGEDFVSAGGFTGFNDARQSGQVDEEGAGILALGDHRGGLRERMNGGRAFVANLAAESELHVLQLGW